MSVTLIDTRAERGGFKDGRQLVWDSVSGQAAQKCWRYYKLKIIDGYMGKGEAVHLKFGLILHSALEYLDHARVSGVYNDTSLIIALRRAMSEAGRRDESGVWLGPWESGNDKKNLESLVRTIIWYFDHYATDAYKVATLSDGRAAVELPCKLRMPFEAYGETVLYAGHLDSIGSFAESGFFLDRKSTGSALSASYFAPWDTSFQMTGYFAIAKLGWHMPVNGGILDAMQIGTGFTRFGRHLIHRTDEQLDEWMKELNFTVEQSLAFHDADYWPMNRASCGSYGGCEYLGVCSKTPSVRQRFLDSNYTRQFWDPMEVRGMA